MLRIRRVHDDLIPRNRETISEVQKILRERFPEIGDSDISTLPEKLRDPLKYRFRSLLFVAEDIRGQVRGFALLLHVPDLQFCYLDYIATAGTKAGSGVGSALYERVRDEARLLKSVGLFFECLPDDPASCPDPVILKENEARLRFYEQFGAYPIAGTEYELPVKPGDRCMPHLVYDDLESGMPLRLQPAKRIVRAILERKYGDYCPPEYVDRVVQSFRDDPIRLRSPRYNPKPVRPVSGKPIVFIDRRIALVVTDRHRNHHVHERGYVEAPVRVQSILEKIEDSGFFENLSPRSFPEKYIRAVHDGDYVDYLRKCCTAIPEGKSVYPYVFPLRNNARPPRELAIRAGYYCIDTFTPLNRDAYTAAVRAVDCAMTAARSLLEGFRMAYALVRPPGHHAERRAFGGFCYFNSAAIAAEDLSTFGKVAILDVDYHHGNGTQDIFYDRNDVLTVSIHGHPRFAYPYFNGFEDEIGMGEGGGFNLNIPLPEKVDGERYRLALRKALKRIEDFAPRFLVVCLGLDPAKGDPTGSWSLLAKDFEENGRMIASLHLPTLVVQEGGYKTRSLGTNARGFFSGLVSGPKPVRSRINARTANSTKGPEGGTPSTRGNTP